VSKNRKLIVPAVILGIILLIVAGIYILEPASSLPSFFPGQEAGSSHHHVKHGIAAGALGIACLIFAWFQSGPSSPSEQDSQPT
jgi:hypothetical protein